MADFISNTFYRKWQKRYSVNGNVSMLLKKTVTGKVFPFPMTHKDNTSAYDNKATE